MRAKSELEKTIMQTRCVRVIVLTVLANMLISMLKPGVVAIAAIAAIALTLLSVRVERTGPELVEYGNLCGPTTSDPCYQPALTGGFPVAFLYDAPGVSVERQLAFVEDDLHVVGLITDVVIYFGTCMLIVLIVSRYKSALRLPARQ